MSENKNPEMLNGGTELETINNATQQQRNAHKHVKAQMEIGTKRRGIQRLAGSVCLGAAALTGIVCLCRIGAMVDLLGTVEACAVCLWLGIEIGRKGVK